MGKRTWTKEEESKLEELYASGMPIKNITKELNRTIGSVERKIGSLGLPKKYNLFRGRDLTGQRFGRLLVIELTDMRTSSGKVLWKCLCDCQLSLPENEREYCYVTTESLVSGKTKSCGCLKEDAFQETIKKNKERFKKDGENKIGETNMSNNCGLMTIVEYNGTYDVVVEFDDEFHTRVHTGYGNFKKGTVRNPNRVIFYGHGYIGLGKYKPTKNKKSTKTYDAWLRMLQRCYDENHHKNNPTYSGCEVCEEWLNFQNFAKWFEENIYYIEGQVMEVDKDWLIFGNKVYSPETCIIVPNIINTCILNHSRRNNLDLPTGIIHTTSNKYKPRLSKYGKRHDLGIYETLEKAMLVYMNAKIEYIKELSDKYKYDIPKKLYNVMQNYENRFLLDNPEYSVLFEEAA